MIPYMITIKIMHFVCVGGQFLPVQWLGLRVLTVEGPGSVPVQGTKNTQAMCPLREKAKGIFQNISVEMKPERV